MDFLSFFFFVIIVKKLPWNYNRGHWEVQAECERQSWLPSRGQVSLKARGRKEGLFYGWKGEKHTHTHTPSVLSLLFLSTYMNAGRCLAREDRNMHAFFQLQALFLSDIIYVSHLSFYLESRHYTHICSQLSLIYRLKQAKLFLNLIDVHILG